MAGVGNASIEYSTVSRGVYSGKSIQRIMFTLNSSSSGAGGSVDSDNTKSVVGALRTVTVQPSKTLKPTDNFDLYLFQNQASLDAQDKYRQGFSLIAGESANYSSIDLLASAGENLPDGIQSTITPSSPPVVAGSLFVTARNMGASKRAKMTVFLE